MPLTLAQKAALQAQTAVLKAQVDALTADAAAPAPPPPPPPSAAWTEITPTAGTLVDETGGVWSGSITPIADGFPSGGWAGVLMTCNWPKLYLKTADGKWWDCDRTTGALTLIADPRPAPAPAPTPAPPPPAPAPAPAPPPAGSFVWQIANGATVSTASGASLPLATAVPSGAIAYASPDLLPGQTLSLSSGTLSLVSASTLPTVNGDTPGGVIDTISDRDIVIEVMDSPMATVVNVTRGITYPYGSSYTGRTDNQPVNRWNAVMWECQPDNIIEVSPGAIHATTADMANYWSSILNESMLSVVRPCTIRNMSGRGRWSLLDGDAEISGDRSGIVIYSPSEGWTVGRGTYTIEGFSFDNWGRYGDGIRIKSDSAVDGVYTWLHSSVTLRNFKIGRRPGYRSYSGVNGAAETMLIEDGDVHDCGGDTAVGVVGQNHNLYITARTMTLRGVKNQRTRGWAVPPSGADWNDNNKLVEGHLAKLEAVTGAIDGCVFDCGSMASATDVSDTSLLLQFKAGGNWTVRGSLFVDSQAPNVANGAISFLREYQDNGTPNYKWFAGIEGNSLLFERNVVVGHFPRPIIWFITPAQSATQALYASGDTSVALERRMSSLTVRDNIAIVATTAQYGSQWVLPGFPSASNSMWINNDPNVGGTWSARGNTTRTYSTDAAAFANRPLLVYSDVAGAPAASQGSASVPQFIWPHGYRNVTRSTQGLG